MAINKITLGDGTKATEYSDRDTPWKVVWIIDGGDSLERAKIPGGYLYRTISYQNGKWETAVTFVPNQDINDMLHDKMELK